MEMSGVLPLLGGDVERVFLHQLLSDQFVRVSGCWTDLMTIVQYA